VRADIARPAWPRRLDLRRIVMHDFPLKAAALVIALLFWVGYTQNATPPDVTVSFDGRVAVERPTVPNGFVLRGNLGDVAVKLSGPEDAVSRIGLADLHATLDISGVDASRPEPHDAIVVVTVAPPYDAVKVVDIAPATIAVRLEQITSRTVVVQAKLANDPPAGTQAAAASVSPKEVRIVGPASLVAQVAAVFATVRFGDVSTNLTDSAPAIPVDANGIAVEGLQVEPGAVVVSVPLLPTATTKTVPVLWTLRGAVANGYWISQVTTNPVAVTVSGAQSVIAQILRVETEPVDVTNVNASGTVRATLLLPEGVTLMEPVSATVTVTVVPLAGTRSFFSAVAITNVAANTDASVDIGTVTAIVAGPAPTLASLGADAVTASVDAAGRAPGTYPVDVAIKLPSGVTLQSVQPTRVTLTIKARL
jgi:YbbR domain-containing protein